ncbi:hypothetical protein GIB67_038796 [Kingdonia uniflora]|uniref:SBP-type domain-containing protein n=1 Tax=Kingdonia uniflora TaxID=39325 RepID=A0A7J7M0N5_9MAGN|nr:hypothetical protein GIB67_038796 [Kingdonia uniflora]
MDWDFKPPSWDFAEFERESATNISSIVGSSSSNIGDKKACSVDLKLGRLGDFGEGSTTTMLSTSPLGSLKRSRAPNNGVQVVSCLVEGCTADLSKCRDYHRRHKVCEDHSKTPRVIVGGQEQRFCQQCSRFHSLVEFDEVKRSCRKRLDGHNRRRRKPQPESMGMSSGSMFSSSQGSYSVRRGLLLDYVMFFISKSLRVWQIESKRAFVNFAGLRVGGYCDSKVDSNSVGALTLISLSSTGTRLIPFANPQVLPSTSVGSATWTGVIKTEEDSTYYNCRPSLHYGDRQNSFSGTFSRTYKGGEKQFPFMPVHNSSLGSRTAPEASVCQPLLNTIASSESGRTSRKLFSDGLSRVLDSDCALSLLSSPSSQTSRINMGHLVHPDNIPIAQPLVQSMNYNGLGNNYQSHGMGSSANDSDIHCQGLFHLGSDGSSQDTVHHGLPFSWE